MLKDFLKHIIRAIILTGSFYKFLEDIKVHYVFCWLNPLVKQHLFSPLTIKARLKIMAIKAAEAI